MTHKAMATNNLNADIGESFSRFTLGDDVGMMGIVKSAIMAGAALQAMAHDAADLIRLYADNAAWLGAS